jgi:uncharacterized membrane protein
MSFCANCGGAWREGAAYCAGCGGLRASEAVAASDVPPRAATSNTATVARARIGITANVAGALSYLFGVVTGIIFLVLDPFKQDRFVRFHAFQSIFFGLTWVGLWIVWMVFTGIFEAVTGGFLAVMIIPIDCLLTMAGIAYWALLMYRAYAGRQHKIPFLGRLAEQQANK